MPLAGPVLGNLIMTQMTAMGFTGTKQLQLAMAIGNGVVSNIQATNIYQGTVTGVILGAGKGTGTVVGVVGPVVGAQINAQFTAQGFTGTKQLQLAMAIGNAFSIHILSGQIQSVSAGCAVGAGVGSILGVVGPAMGTTIYGMMTAQGLTGTKTLQMANAIGNGIASSLSAAKGITVVTGGGYPPSPSSGTEVGKLL